MNRLLRLGLVGLFQPGRHFMSTARQLALCLLLTAHAFAAVVKPVMPVNPEPALSPAKPLLAASAAAPAKPLVVFIELTDPPAVLAYGQTLEAQGPAAASLQQLQPGALRATAVAAARAQIAVNMSAQTRAMNAVKAAGIANTELYRVSKAMNGIAIYVAPSDIERLRAIPGVKSVRIMHPSYPMSATSVPFISAPQVWQGSAVPQADGTGIRIGIIDSGIDFLHADFGGKGLEADYKALDRSRFTPTAKVVGGIDLAGDAYDANDAKKLPVPGPNPMDCGGHGSHVAGTAAGFGVKTDGSTYSGPYDSSVPATLRILPGVAPKALLYAIRVFGCSGSTNLVVQAIDWALDPNGDGNLADHLDVINMSLGSDRSYNPVDAEASDNAALAGMIVVAAAGNAGDSYMITGSPASAARAISVAASQDSGETAGRLTITAPAAITGSYQAIPAAFGPALPATPLAGTLVYALPNNGCTALSNAAVVTGKIAVIDRGTCNFDLKVSHAQSAGAIGVIVVDNRVEAPLEMGVGTKPPLTITIASVMISQTDGQLIEAQLSGAVSGSLASGISVADSIYSSSSRGPSPALVLGLKPDLAAPGVNIVSVVSGITPDPTVVNAGNQAAAWNGTSMATPHVAGLMALLRQLHPSWSVEELKALAMNSATHDLTTVGAGAGIRYGAGRVGAGRVDAANAAQESVIAYNADGSGTVSVAFAGEIVGTTSVTRKVRVVNHGANSVNLTLAIDTVVDNPGISFSLPGGSSLTLASGASADIDVTMSGNANQVTHSHDATIFPVQTDDSGTSHSRQFLTEETAYLNFSIGTDLKLRVPLYVAPYPASTMSAGGAVPTGGAASGSGNLTLSGTGVCTGSLAGSTCSTSFPTDEESLVTPFELQVINPRTASIPAHVDIQYAGVALDSANGLLNFGISSWGRWSLPNGGGRIQITLYDAVTNVPSYQFAATWASDGQDGLDVYGISVCELSSDDCNFFPYANLQDGSGADTRIFQNNVMFLTVPLDWVGLTASSSFKYSIETYDNDGWMQNSIGPKTYNLGAPGLDFNGGWLLEDLPGASIPFNWDLAKLKANKSLGGLLLHHHNAAGTTAEALYLPLPASTLDVVAGDAQSALIGHAFGQTLQVRLSDELGLPKAGMVVLFTLPASGASGTFAGSGRSATVQTDASGVATSPLITANQNAGSYQATANASGLNKLVNFSLSNTSLTSRLINFSTRGQVQTLNNVMIGGFIIQGATPKKVLIRASGPNLANYGVSGVLADPMLELHRSSDGAIIASNDDWGSATNAAEISATTLAPVNSKESAILATLDPGAYTAIVTGKNAGTGVGIVEVYEIDHPEIPLVNISTRGRVEIGDGVMIGGFIIQGSSPQTVLIRAAGPNLANYGVAGVLANPKLDLYSGQTIIASNDDWQAAANAAAIQATGLAPSNVFESAILISLQPGAYTAIVSGADGGSGIAIVEVFAQ